jgi:hypothetical protein
MLLILRNLRAFIKPFALSGGCEGAVTVGREEVEQVSRLRASSVLQMTALDRS